MGAFDTAWLVLKNERELRQIGEGGYRAVYAGDNKNEVIKVPRSPTYDFELSHNALMNAFAQLGYPVEPEKLQILPPHRAINPNTADMAMAPVTVRPFHSPAYTQRRMDSGRHSIGEMMDYDERDIQDDLLGVHGYNLYGRKDLRDNTSPAAFNMSDLKNRNLGVFDGKVKALDALTRRPTKLMESHSVTLPHRLADLPEEERRSLVNLFTDKSQFQDIADFDFSRDDTMSIGERKKMRESDPRKLRDLGYRMGFRGTHYRTPMEAAHDAYAAYLQDVRAMQLANSIVEDPYQTRIDEFVDPNEEVESLSSFDERARAMKLGQARREVALQNTGDMDKIGPTFPYYPGLETLFPPPRPQVEAPQYNPLDVDERRRLRLLGLYTDTDYSENGGGPAPAA